jgi:hypothetical protein
VGWLDRLVALEELLSRTGVPKSRTADLGDAYTSAFLAMVRPKVRMGVIP